jgi:hypothetical protein
MFFLSVPFTWPPCDLGGESVADMQSEVTV